MRRFILSFACLIAFFSAGCIQSDLIVHVKPDGSGTIDMTLLMKDEMAEMLLSMGEEGASKELFSREELLQRASAFGEGVTYVSHEPYVKDGFQGVKAVFSFTDLNQVRLESNPQADGSEAAESEPITFAFEKTGKNKGKITAHMPQPTKPDSAEASEEPPSMPTDEELEQLKTFFDGLRFGAFIVPEGKIDHASTPYVDGSTVTLMEVDMTLLLANPEKFHAFAAAGEPADVADALARLKDVPGIKVPPAESVTIEFSGN